MMAAAAAQHFIFTGEEERDENGDYIIPQNATHFSVHEFVTVIPEFVFYEHQNIVELICHAGVKKIEGYAFYNCPRLKRLIIPGVEVVEMGAFDGCEAVTDIECPKLERVRGSAFYRCKSLANINLPSARVVMENAFARCTSLADAKFGTHLESIAGDAFLLCPSLERITVPLKNGLFPDDVFQGCYNLKCVYVVEGEELHDTIDALLLAEWRNDMNEQFDSIDYTLPETYAGYYDLDAYDGEEGDKARVIREWIAHVLQKIMHYKAQHRSILDEMIAPTLQFVLPKDIVMNNILRFLELPFLTFEEVE